MPRETVSGVDHDGYNVQVGWQADRDVQLGVEQAEGRALVSMVYGSPEALERIGRGAVTGGLAPFGPGADRMSGEEAADLGRAILNLVEGNPNDVESSCTGVWANLDRAGCNRLIRTLRRARDAAFGRDE